MPKYTMEGIIITNVCKKSLPFHRQGELWFVKDIVVKMDKTDSAV